MLFVSLWCLHPLVHSTSQYAATDPLRPQHGSKPLLAGAGVALA